MAFDMAKKYKEYQIADKEAKSKALKKKMHPQVKHMHEQAKEPKVKEVDYRKGRMSATNNQGRQFKI